MELTYNEKRLLAVLKPLKDAEEARSKAVEPIRETLKGIGDGRSARINPLKDTLKVLEETRNIAFLPIKKAIELLENTTEGTLGPMHTPDAAYLARIMDSTEEAVVQYANLLQDRGLAIVEKKSVVTYRLTEEGEEYRKSGLPERNLIDSFDTEIPMGELQKHPQSRLGIGWLRKKGWVDIKDGIVTKKVKQRKESMSRLLKIPSQASPASRIS